MPEEPSIFSGKLSVIQLTKGWTCLVDADLYEALAAVPWYAMVPNNGQSAYAARRDYAAGRPGVPLLMHRVIMGAVPGRQVDHRRHFPREKVVDNRRSNLRLCGQSENNANARKCAGKTSIFKGVYWSAAAKKWAAQICVLGAKRHLGLRETEAEAALLYDLAAVEAFGDFARTNYGVANVG